MSRPSISFRLDENTINTFKAIALEAGVSNWSQALEAVLNHMTRPDNISTTKNIISRAIIKA